MKLCRTLYTIIFVVALVKREALARSKGPAERIHGGVEVPLGDAPFQVSLQEYGRHFCGGSIVDPSFIITAAHCCCHAKQSSSLSVAAGLNNLRTPEYGSQKIPVACIIVHPDRNTTTMQADICILRLKDSLILSAERRTDVIKLPPSGYKASGDANVIGWGQTDDDTSPVDDLMRATIPIIPDDVCRQKYPAGTIFNEMICAGEEGKGSCVQDDGGPLVDSEGFLVGVVSRGGCGSAPDVYTEVSYFTQWIKNHILVNSTLEDQASS